MSGKFLGYGRQYIDENDIRAVVETLRSDFLTQGPAVERFEAALAEYAEAKHAVAVSSGTAALHVACLAAGVGPGDLGVTSAVTFVASANCLYYAGGEADLVDIDPSTLGMMPGALRRSIAAKPQTKVVIPVHLAGLAASAEEIRAIAGPRIVIEDAAHSFGGTYADGRRVGSCVHSDMTILSFHPVKAITTAEGGAVTTNDDGLAARLRSFRSHGIGRDAAAMAGDAFENGAMKPWYYEQSVLGFNYRLSDIQAALGLSQLSRLDRFVSRRREIARRYDEVFSRMPFMRLTQSAPDQRGRSAHHLYVALFDWKALRTTRSAFMTKLRASGIGTQVHYIPVYRQPYHAARGRYRVGNYEAAERYYEACLSLPIQPGMTDEQVESVVDIVIAHAGG